MFKKLFILLILFVSVFLISQNTCCASSAQTTANYTNYKECIRQYKLPVQKLYFLAVSAIPANKYEIKEMQSRNGYVIFEADGREFLLTAMKKDKSYSYLRLTPCDNNYYFSPSIPQKIFRYIDVNFNEEVKELKF